MVEKIKKNISQNQFSLLIKLNSLIIYVYCVFDQYHIFNPIITSTPKKVMHSFFCYSSVTMSIPLLFLCGRVCREQLKQSLVFATSNYIRDFTRAIFFKWHGTLAFSIAILFKNFKYDTCIEVSPQLGDNNQKKSTYVMLWRHVNVDLEQILYLILKIKYKTSSIM